MSFIRLVGDVHQKTFSYVDLVKGCPYSIQLGDMGFDYSDLAKLEPSCHKFIPGNHENYGQLPLHALNGFGLTRLWDLTFFYVRGAFSIDYNYRTVGVDWFYEEQLSSEELENAIELYKQVKPNIVLSHDCPQSISNALFPTDTLIKYGYNPPLYTRTAMALQCMLDAHKPDFWAFGHYHQSVDTRIDGIRFVCLNELETFDLKV